jgi:quaternary ammonium compound-resistance protein SugE
MQTNICLPVLISEWAAANNPYLYAVKLKLKSSKGMAWIYLIIAGAFEVGFTTSLKLSDNFTNKSWSLVFVICISSSFYFLNKAIQTIPIGTAYAVWTGIGAVGTVIVGMAFFREPSEFWRLFFIFLLIGSILGLKLVSSH